MQGNARGPLSAADSGRLAAVLVALLAVLAGAAPARAANGPEYFGTNLQTIGFIPQDRWSTYLQPLQAGQMSIDRIEVRWPVVEPDAPQGGVHRYDWSSTDFLIATMAARGLRAAPLFRFSPDWAKTADPSKPGGVDELPPSSYDDYAAMMAAFARRYGPGGSFWNSRRDLRALPTASYELWNEANLDQYAWNQRADATVYSAALKAVRPVLKAAQPSALLVGSLAWQTSGPGVVPDFVAKLAAAGGLAQLDAVGYHPYAPDAQSILTLVQGLRRELTAAGYPGLPIYANETGQPVVLDGPGAQYAFAGRPSDAARASSVAFAGEALAASDCGVDQFLLYALVGTETELEPIGEGFMGMVRKADGSPNATGQALQRASLRWAAKFRAGAPGLPGRLGLCSGGASPDAALLPIDGAFTATASGCVAVKTTYDGNPFESAVLRLFDPRTGAQVAESRTDAFGGATACIPEPIRGQPYTAVADVAGAGRTATVRCDVAGVIACGPDAAPTPAPAAPERPLAAPQCGSWTLVTTAQRPREGRRGRPTTTRLRLGALCAVAPAGARVSVTVLLQKKGRKSTKKLRVVWLDANKPRTVVISADVKRGDRLVVRQPQNVALNVPYVRRQLVLGRVVPRE